MNCYSEIRSVIAFICLIMLFADAPAKADNDALGESPTIQPTLTGDQILERVLEASKQKALDPPSITYLRKAIITDLSSSGKIRKVTRKTYRAFTDNRDQLLIELNHRPATAKEREKDRAHNLDRQQRYLHRQAKSKSNHDLMAKNIQLFREKFLVKLSGEEQVNGRRTYQLQLIPNRNHKLDHHLVDRLMNAVQSNVWVDAEDFCVTRLQVKLTKPVSVFGGFAGVLRDIQIDLQQTRLEEQIWVDEKMTSFFNVRVFLKNYRFRMKSRSTDFRPVAPVIDTTTP